jgi:hypothetical protein
MFTTTFIALWVGIIQLIWYIKGTIMNIYTLGDQTLLTGKAGVDQTWLLGSASNATGAPSFPLSFPDFFRDFISQAKLANEEGIPLNSHILENSTTPPSFPGSDGTRIIVDQSQGVIQAVYQNPMYLYIAVGCFILFTVLLSVAVWRLWVNRTPKI